MDILDDYFAMRGYRHLRLDGSTSAKEREESMVQVRCLVECDAEVSFVGFMTCYT